MRPGHVLLAALVACSCGGDAEPEPCPGGPPCATDRPTALTQPQSWHLEVVPAADAPWAVTEKGVTFGGAVPVVTLERRRVVRVVIEHEPDPEDPVVPTVRVLLVVPSAAGRDRVFEGQGGNVDGTRGRLVVRIGVPASVHGPGRLLVLPDPPFDRTMPPWVADVRALDDQATFTAPRAADMWFVEGTLLSGFDQPVAGFVARAAVGGVGVSTVDQTDAQGRFRLRIPRGTSAAAAAPMVQVALSPPDPADRRPRLEIPNVGPARASLGVLKLPTDLPALKSLRVPVMVESKRVAGAILRFQTTIAGAVGGTALFRREARVDSGADTFGLAQIELLPGTATAPREYSVVAIPPPNASYGVHCRSYSVGVAVGVGAAIEPSPLAEIRGQVLGADQQAIADVRVVATRRDDAQDEGCGGRVPALPYRTLTDREGRFRLMVEPGRPYRVDYDPPASSRSPIFSQEVTFTAGQAHHVVLPAGVVVEGVIRTPDGGGPPPGCEVRATEPVLMLPPSSGEVRAHARSGPDGRFRLVLPVRSGG